MAYLKEKFVLLKKALKSWDKILIEPYSEIVRDAAIQRYEFSCAVAMRGLIVIRQSLVLGL